jgi:predicted CxxxxCH...CXXCH cytochrome family protein
MAEPASPRTRRPAFEHGATVSLALVSVGAVVAALLVPGCLERRDEPPSDPEVTRCTSCHGDPSRSGDYLARAAPPYDLLRATDPSYPGVGAHQIHLNAGSTHGAVACDECHVVPADVSSPGHADDGPPGDVVFGTLAQRGGRNPVYDPATRTCQSSYCHREASAVWTEPRDSATACGTCHALPPPLPHPQSERCSVCHGEVVDADRNIIAPERHVDGVVDYVAGDCKTCHGSDRNPAPPLDTLGNDAVSAIGVGAHQVHLEGGANGRALDCSECHVVPEHVEDPTHVDGLPAEVRFEGVARTDGRRPAWDEAGATCAGSYCHAPTPGDRRSSPVWNEEKPLVCTSCHDLPPPLPHPQSGTCSACHGAVVGPDDRTIIDKSRHVNGTVDVSLDDATCTSCHGGRNAAPPVDAEGNAKTTAPGVGAHQTHVRGTERSRAVPCAECHVVPKSVLADGHVDSARPAELSFSGVALAQGAAPAYSGGTCQSTSCHGAVFPNGDPSGGSNTEPTWTRVDGTEAACGSCHAVPPPPPHPFDTYPCSHCHGDIADDGVTFTHPELHVDGNVTFQLE